MADLLKTGSDWLGQMQQKHAAQPVTCTRQGSAQQVAIDATLGRTDYEVNDEFTGAVTAEAVDFVVPTADLSWIPQEGDQFRLTYDDGTVGVYEVMSIPGEGHYRYSDPYHQRLRIHTKKVATE